METRLSEPDVIRIHQRDEALELEVRTAARLVPAIRAGDTVAETEMIERYSRGLRYLLVRRVGDEERAQDLLHDTFCIALEKLRKTDLDNPERLAGYLRGIAVRVALNAGRKRDREPLPVETEVIAAVPDHEPPPLEQISDAETLQAVREMLQTMPVQRDRDLLIRLYVYDQDKQEICQALGLDSLHFNRVLFRAKNRFKALLMKSGSLDDLAVPNDS